MTGPTVGPIKGNPSPDEVAAIVAAIDTGWPEPVPALVGAQSKSTTWRFSGRWWAKPNRRLTSRQ